MDAHFLIVASRSLMTLVLNSVSYCACVTRALAISSSQWHTLAVSSPALSWPETARTGAA